MDKKESPTEEAIQNSQCKVSESSAKAKEELKLSPKEREIYDLLSNGGKYSAMDFATKCGTTKGVNRVNDMRNRGIRIDDEWRTTTDGKTRYKVYFLPTKINH